MRAGSFCSTTLAVSVLLATVPITSIPSRALEWRAGDDAPIAEPAFDPSGDYVWWDGTYNMTVYQAERLVGGLVADLGGEDGEARGCNARDEALDSSWFTNRHARARLSAAALRRGAPEGRPPLLSGPLTIVSAKTAGATPGFIVRDRGGERYLIKFDPPEIPEMATGSEMVSSRILYALGWNVPSYDLVAIDPGLLEIDREAKTLDGHRTRPMTSADLARLLTHTPRRPDGTIRVVASHLIAGIPKGPFRTRGTRPDDANDRIPHQDRRDLRGLRIVAAWINYTDARRGNFFDTFVTRENDPPGTGHLVHYFLDFSSTLGSGNTEWKSPDLGNQYVFDPVVTGKMIFSLGLWTKPWAKLPAVSHPALGYFEGVDFDPRRWRTSYPQPLFDKLTVRDSFWGAKLIASLTHADLEQIAAVGEWADPSVAPALVAALERRRQKIFAVYFDARHIAPIDGFHSEARELCFQDLAVETSVAARPRARYRYRPPQAEWVEGMRPCVPMYEHHQLALAVSHDGGEHWSPPAMLQIGDPREPVRSLVRLTH